MKFLHSLLCISFLFLLSFDTKPIVSKINGVNFVAPSRVVRSNPMEPVVNLGAGWISVMPYAYSNRRSPGVRHNTPWQWWGEKTSGTIATIKFAQEKGLKVMLKPHIWVSGEGWAGDFFLESESDWQEWEKEYEAYILPLAIEAEKLGVEMICIATEYRQIIRKRPEYFPKLIKQIRKVYSGKLTYAANWDNFDRVKFWDQLDYIGIDAYFPLSEEKNANEDVLCQSWAPHKKQIREVQKKFKKPVLFTEYGYCSVAYGARRPWEEGDLGGVSMEAQSEAYKAIYQTFWHEPWFAGGFIWKWYDYHERVGGKGNRDFTPQNKPVMEVIKKWYK
ncbi:MAG: hypothetical protein AAFR87_21840 [Bacteroidota bacterium]